MCENREFFKVSLEIIKSVFNLIDGRWYKGQLDEKDSNDINLYPQSFNPVSKNVME